MVCSNLMSAPARILQPRYYNAFRCIGADCEDTCCNGWDVTIDRQTYNKYRECGDPELGPSFSDLITINTVGASDADFARVNLSGSHCPFLSERLCSIQKKLGEDYLPDTCAIYPRMMNRVADVLERTLDLSCPEAARAVLLDPHSLDLVESINEAGNFRIGSPSVPDSPSSAYEGRTYRYFLEVRTLVVTILRERTYSLWKRLFILGHLCDKLNEMAAMNDDVEIPALIEHYLHAIHHGWFNELLSKCHAQPAVQLITVLELIISRITSDYTGRRFLDCYQDFMQGLELTTESAAAQMTGRYADAYKDYYAPFVDQNPYLMERYLVAYVYKNLFPLGRLELNRKCGIHGIANSISIQYMLMTAYYAVIRTVLIGMAGFNKSTFGMEHVIKLIQCCTKEFQHCTSFPVRAIEILMRNGLRNGASMAVLVQDLNSGAV